MAASKDERHTGSLIEKLTHCFHAMHVEMLRLVEYENGARVPGSPLQISQYPVDLPRRRRPASIRDATHQIARPDVGPAIDLEDVLLAVVNRGTPVVRS